MVVFPYSYSMMENLLMEFQPQIVGAGSVTMTFDSAVKVIQDVKQISPNTVTIMGGPHVTFDYQGTLEKFWEVDAVVMGEGEKTIVELAAAVESCRPGPSTPFFNVAAVLGEAFSSIKGLAFQGENGVVSTGARDLLQDLDSLPEPARHLVPLGRYRALGMSISMTTSRGCPFKCIFCVGRRMVGAKVRYRDPVKVVDELEYLASLNFRQVNLADDLFTANEKHCLAVCNEIMARGLKLKWTSFARVDTVTPRVLKEMKKAGCCNVSFGIETGSPEIMKTIRKGITLDQVVRAVEMCVEAGLEPHASFILGLPGETPETLKQTVAFSEKLKAMGVQHGFHSLAPFPGTQVRDDHEDFGLKILSHDWADYHANQAIVETETVKADMMDEIVSQWQSVFDDYLKNLGKKIDAGDATEAEAFPLVSLVRTIIAYDLMMDQTIENLGAFPDPNPPANQEAAVEVLMEKIAGSIEHPPEKIKDTLLAMLTDNNLKYKYKDSQYTWAWVDFL